MRTLVTTIAAALSLAAFSAGPVSAAPGASTGATDKTIHIVGEEKFAPDEFSALPIISRRAESACIEAAA